MMTLSLLFISSFFLQSSASGLWASTPASYDDIIRQAYPFGNGRLGAMPFGPPGDDKVSLNIDSLWSGGPFESNVYSGGNPNASVAQFLPGIREWIFQNGTGNVSQLLGDGDNYGSYQVFANLSIAISGVTASTTYNRSLDFDMGIHTTTYRANDGSTYISIAYCSFPEQVCVYNLSSSQILPDVSIRLENQLLDEFLFNISCEENSVRLAGFTQLGPPTGMRYDGIARLSTQIESAYCSKGLPGTLIVPSNSQIRSLSLVFGANTNYDQLKGNAENNYSYQGEDPAEYVENITSSAVSKDEIEIRQRHIMDYQSHMHEFTLSLPDSCGSVGLETSVIINRYTSTGPGDPYLEATLFEYSRHLFVSSTRDNSLPPNLQGRWSPTLTAAWSADYHANINLQMNHWGIDQTGLGHLQVATWNYIQNTWVPRGTETANLLYNATGYVCHDEMNIFGHTGMKDTAQWANYPASAAWMMQHVFDHFSYSQDINWLKTQGYPLLKGVALFWRSQLQKDGYFDDGTLVVNNCNSPEHGPTTFACTHYQQLIHQLFVNVLSISAVVEETDSDFIVDIKDALEILDKGLHIGSWGEVKEWKVPDSFGYDFENDTHRHLSNLYGWYPGYSMSAFLDGYSNATIQKAVATTLWSRGIGTGPDADAGWEKVWRGACWARLNNTERAYFELRHAIDTNFAGNGLSMYSALSTPFQIDANFGLAGNILSMLIVDLPNSAGSDNGTTVVLGPAIPLSWGGGSVKNLRLRGGGSVDFKWDLDGKVTSAHIYGRTKSTRVLNLSGETLDSIE